jgi:hypothetical protein
MKAQTLWTKAAAGLGSVALALTLAACSHTPLAKSGQGDYGTLRTEQAAQQNEATPGNTVATAPAPSNTQDASGNPGTPAIISGPAKVDNSGRVYTSSSVGSAGNASATGLNTNVNIIPKTQSSSTVVTTQSAPVVTETQTATIETAPLPTTTTTTVVESTPAPAPVVESTPAPMTSSTTVEQSTTTTTTETTPKETKTTHRRMRKD